MIEVTFQQLSLYLLLVLLSSLCGWLLSSLAPWSREAEMADLPRATGLLLGPFVAGGMAVVALTLLPGVDGHSQMALIIGLPLLLVLLFWRRAMGLFRQPVAREPAPLSLTLLRLLLLVWGLLLLLNAVLFPLVQNDALEYAIVGKELLAERSLAHYPLLNSDRNLTGFFGPWTHPPLYVSLIYTAFSIQEGGDAPGLMRLLAPWFLIAAVIGTGALGRLHNRHVGVLASILLLSTPVLFRGASSALIDALPVAGATLVMALLVGLRTRGSGYGAWLGAGLGALLWTHSQAVLFIPITMVAVLLRNGLAIEWTRWRELAALLMVALLVGGAPYLHNWQLYGAPVSDQPQVYALESLDWSGYFTMARGLGNWPAVIQYGVFKALFSPAFYGVLYWVMLYGLVRLVAVHFQVGGDGSEGLGGRRLYPTAAVIVGLYFLGVLASVLLGMDVLVRNDRYLSITVPAAALIAAYGLWWLFWASPRRTFFTWVSALAAVAYMALSLVTWGWYYNARYAPLRTAGNLASRFDEILSNWSSFRVVRQLEEMADDRRLVLAMRPSNMYYAHRRMVSYLDPRLLDFYRASDLDEAEQKLKALGIGFVQTTDYLLPPMYNSRLQDILADPRRSRLLLSAGGDQLYELTDSGLRVTEKRDVSPSRVPWTRWRKVDLPGMRLLVSKFARPAPFGGDRMSQCRFPLFQRSLGAMIGTGQIGLEADAAGIPVEPGGEYLIEFFLRGRGFVRLWMVELDGQGRRLRDEYGLKQTIRIGELALTGDHPVQRVARRIRAHDNVHRIWFGIEHRGQSILSVDRVLISRLESGSAAGWDRRVQSEELVAE